MLAVVTVKPHIDPDEHFGCIVDPCQLAKEEVWSVMITRHEWLIIFNRFHCPDTLSEPLHDFYPGVREATGPNMVHSSLRSTWQRLTQKRQHIRTVQPECKDTRPVWLEDAAAAAPCVSPWGVVGKPDRQAGCQQCKSAPSSIPLDPVISHLTAH